MRKLIPVFLIVALVACRKEEFTSGGGGGLAAERASGSTNAMYVASGSPPPPPATLPPRTDLQRMIIRSASISMIVDDTAGSIDRITAAAEAVGGFVSDSKVWRDGEQLRGSITLRVPSDRLSAALAVVRKLAVRINSETIGTQDATQEYVDLESQLRNLEAAEVELRQLMTTIRERSKKASEVLEIYQQLSTIRSQIEQIKGRMRYLSQLTSFASMQIELVPNALAKPVVEPGWQPLVIVKNASRSLVGALQSFAAAGIWLAIYILPMFLILGFIAFLAWRVITVTWKTRRSPTL